MAAELGLLAYYDREEFGPGPDGGFTATRVPGLLNAVVWPLVADATSGGADNGSSSNSSAASDCGSDANGCAVPGFCCSSELAAWHKLLIAGHRAFEFMYYGGPQQK